jgi:formate/nitrite transporter FocA (FNT family)
MAFVTIGFEHSVANMFFIPLGIFAANDAGIAATLTAAKVTIPASLLGTGGWINFLWNNLIPVTLGNIVGAAVFVAMAYWWVYIRSPVCVTPAQPAEAAKIAPK